MKKWIIGAVIAIAALAGIAIVTTPSDEELIRQAIAKSTEASRNGEPGGVAEYLSKSLTFNGMEMFDQGEIRRFVRLTRPNVTFGQYEPQIQGDEATVTADVALDIDSPQFQFNDTIRNVRVILAKESGYRWLVFPSPKWRIREVSAPDLGVIPGSL